MKNKTQKRERTSRSKKKTQKKKPYQTTTLKNGLKVIMNHNPNQTTVTIAIFVKTGSNWETLEVNGIAHFIEHLFFKGTRHRPSQKDISKDFEQYAAKSNAFTSHELTCYHVKVNSDYYKEVIEILGDVMTNSLFRAEDIEVEKKVVINELKQRYSDAHFLLNSQFYHKFFKGHPIAKSIIGKSYLIKKFNRFKVMAFLYYHYHPSNLAISVSGNFKSYSELEKILNQNFGSNYHYKWKLDSTFFKTEYEKLHKYKSQWEKVLSLMTNQQNFSSISKKINYHTYSKELEHTFVIIAFPGVAFKDPAKYHLQLLAHVLGVGMSSRLFDRIRSQEGLVYSVRASHQANYYNGVFTIEYSCQHKPKDQIRILNLIKEEIDQIKGKIIEKEEYQKIISKLISSVKMSQESSYENCFHYGYQLVKGKEIKTYQDVMERYQSISPADLQINAQMYFNYQKMMISTLSPVKIKAETYHKIFLQNLETKNENSKK